MTAGGESADASDLPGKEVVDCDFGREPAEVSPTLVNATAGEQVVSALSSGPMTHLDGASSGPRRALVLGGGGVLGFAWIVGALSALQVEAGFDARDVQLVVGTSAGAVAAAALGCAVSVDQMRRHHQGITAPDDPPIAFQYDATGRGLPPRPGFGFGSPRLLLGGVRHPRRSPTLLTLTGALPTGRGSLQPVAEMVTGIAEGAGLTGRWPIRPRPWIVAVDYWSGRRVVFGHDQTGSTGAPNVSLPDAVVASCSIPAWYPPMRIGGHPYIDGGAASNASADLLVDEPVDEVYVLAPMASIQFDRPRSPVARIERSIRRAITRGILADVAQLRASGKHVLLVSPGPEDLELIGANLDESPTTDCRSGKGNGDRDRRASGTAGWSEQGTVGTALLAATGVRVYLPSTLSGLRQLVADGAVHGSPLTAFAVTPGLRDWYQDDDIEELEYAATMEAARSSLRALDDDPAVPRRRVVLAADVPDSSVTIRDDRDRGVVEIGIPVTLDRIAAAHVDDPQAEGIIAAAAAAMLAADLGDPDAQDRVDDAEGLGLSWYASQELPILIEMI